MRASISSSLSHTKEQYDLGPNLESPPLLKRGKSIFQYAYKNHRTQIFIMTAALLLLMLGIFKWDVLSPPTQIQNAIMVPSVNPSNWADWWMRVQSFLGIGTLFVALFVWYSGIRDDWENHLPKRMSVFFFHLGRPVIICRYVWLAGADDLRAWGQQVAAQAAFNKRHLEFSPEIRTGDPDLIVEMREDTICQHYTICFQLNGLPTSLKDDSSTCRYQNYASKNNDVQSIPSEMVAELSAVADWKSYLRT